MVLENDILPYFEWLFGSEEAGGALRHFLLVILGFGFLALVLCYLFSAARHGFLRGGDSIFRIFTTTLRDLLQLSPRRVGALSNLAVKEAWRRKVAVVLGVFVLILLFASWFLKPDAQDPGRLYTSFVLTATTYLMLGIALLLSAFSLPGDFKSRTIYTLVTKPVRSGEIVLGRLIGFVIIGTALLAVMGVCSFVFVDRSLNHVHQIEDTSLRRVPFSNDEQGYVGRTTLDMYHRHDVELDVDHRGVAISNNGHFHRIEAKNGTSVVLPSEGAIQARVPAWGKLRFLDRQGVEQQRGINVGNEWSYRGYIAGNTQSAAIWTFDNIDETIDPHSESLPIGLTVRVFRSHKGIIGKRIPGGIRLRNPETGVQSQLQLFEALDGRIFEYDIPRKLVSSNDAEIDLFDDLVSSQGQIEISVHCLAGGQYFGFAQPDCYLRMPDASPVLNYLKVYLSIWVQMVIVMAIGVSVSAVVSGPIAMLFTVSFLLLGFFRGYFFDIATGNVYGGGPVESLYRLLTQMNMTIGLEPGATSSAIKFLDSLLQKLMWCVSQVLPDFSAFSTVDFAASGFDVPVDKIFQDLTTCLAYASGMVVIGYFLLRSREIAR